MSQSSNPTDYRKFIGNDESLAIFLKGVRSFDSAFCENLTSGADFTIRLEIHGNAGEILHCRTYQDVIDRPKGVEKRVAKRQNEKT